jgi:hypothetical protein
VNNFYVFFYTLRLGGEFSYIRKSFDYYFVDNSSSIKYSQSIGKVNRLIKIEKINLSCLVMLITYCNNPNKRTFNSVFLGPYFKPFIFDALYPPLREVFQT